MFKIPRLTKSGQLSLSSCAYPMSPSYLQAHRSGKLAENIRRGLKWLKKCSLCPRGCGVDRTSGETGYCRTGRHAMVASYSPHFGEESPLVGRRGSGTIFFSYCNLGCIFCQNYEISHAGCGEFVTPEELADIMLYLQGQGCHNINLVTPSHVIVQILEALPHAIAGGLRVPLVYNTGAYDKVPALKLLDGIVDIYMPDFKFWDSSSSATFCDAPDYPDRAREAIREMHRQVGDLECDAGGIALKGLLVRHLVMPEGLAGTSSVLHFLAREISPNTYVNLMDQYHPCGKAVGHATIGRTLTSGELEDALEAARREGLKRLDQRHKHWVLIEM
jgi:putative pyruvate formate lyase activating enzyme